jgi:D-psicose/D-tagatose/L-ribulose 3-epimerase
MSWRFRHAVCNELYEGRPFSAVCRASREAGYTGIEIAPFTLGEDPAAIPAAKRHEYRSAIEAEGLQFVGLHWLLAKPGGLHVTTPDRTLRERSWEYLRRLVDLCADLGPRGLLVFGSPKQRSVTDGATVAEAAQRFEDGLARLAPYALGHGVTVLIEALSPAQTSVVTTLDEAAAMVRRAGSPAIRTMFDCHNAVDEGEPHATLVDRHFDLIAHVHLNEMDGRHPGTGTYDYKPLLDVLRRRGYEGWLSLEAFDFSPGAERIAADSLHHMESEVAKLT